MEHLARGVARLRWSSKRRLGERAIEQLPWLRDDRARRFGTTIMALPLSSSSNGLHQLLAQADDAVVLMPPTEAALLQARFLFREAPRSYIPVIVGRPQSQGNRWPSWLRRRLPIHGIGNDSQARSVSRRLLKCRVGLALSAGSAKGLAHIGVIQVLEENGIEVDLVTGVSMGAYVAACWCAGHNGASLEALAATMSDRLEVLKLADAVFPPRRGFIRGRKVKRRLRRSINNATFGDLHRPLRVVATDLETLGATVIDEGDVASAVHASLAIPGICTPVNWGNRLHTDGGACCPLPVEVLEDLGVERIIAVNTQPSLEDLTLLAMDQGRPRKPLWMDMLRSGGRILNRHLNYFAKGNLLDTVMRGLQAAQVRMAESAGKRADVYLHAYPTGARWFAFDAYAEAIAAGRQAAEAQLAALKALTPNPN